MLDPASGGPVESLPAGNGSESEIGRFLSLLDMPDPDAAAYVNEHRGRLLRTLSMLPMGSPQMRALELGSYLHMAAAMQRVLGYGVVSAAYYAPSVGRHTASLPIRGQDPFAVPIDLFDVELHKFPYADSSFDVVLCCEMIEHLLHDPMHMLAEIRRVLSEGGLLVVTTPNTASLTSVWAALDGRHNPQVFSRYPRRGNPDVPHVREYTPHELFQTLSAAGFEIESLSTTRSEGARHASWVVEVLLSNGFDTALRGEQIYCLARKSSSAGIADRFPDFLYSK